RGARGDAGTDVMDSHERSSARERFRLRDAPRAAAEARSATAAPDPVRAPWVAQPPLASAIAWSGGAVPTWTQLLSYRGHWGWPDSSFGTWMLPSSLWSAAGLRYMSTESAECFTSLRMRVTRALAPAMPWKRTSMSALAASTSAMSEAL